ncbi:ABC transporter ATP-binding protein [Actinacidiphila rubida]|uniref:ABC transporter ATP-binding protein n=1 Tax=Actinacidiphila rubida TaxID=310780 RepID=UPI0008498BC8|nr:ABC transporter ATP-binding protein [Actinacidiphila rubida]
MSDVVLDIRGLTVDFRGAPAVRGVDLTLRRGEVLGLVGESGSGKSVTALAAMGLLPDSARVGGSVRLDGTELVGASDAALSRLRGNRIAMVFQDPLTAFTPVYRIGDQIVEAIRTHQDLPRAQAARRAVELLDLVGIPEPALRAQAFPHEFSGGMRQRAMIAMAVANDPDVLLADEPTTALDVTIQAQILDVLRTAQRETGAALLLVSHDLGVIAGSADRVAVMYAGRIVESAEVETLFARPRMPYTLGLIGAVPRLDGPAGPEGPAGADVPAQAKPVDAAEPAADAAGLAVGPVPTPTPALLKGGPVAEDGALLVAEGLRREFKRGRHAFTAVDDVSLTVRAGETLGVVGESGSGKTTLGRMLVRLLDPTRGRIHYGGRDIAPLGDRALRPLRRELQMVFQDPVSSLNPRRSIGESIADPLRAEGRLSDAAVVSRVKDLLERVGLDPDWYHRYPHEFSGGQRQRVGIARALAPEPKLIVCDEPVSALDVTTQAQVVALLGELQRDLGLALVFIAHDLAVVRQVSDRVAVMRGGRIVESGTVDQVYDAPRDPYTKGLLAAVPVLDPAEAAERRENRRELRSVMVTAP